MKKFTFIELLMVIAVIAILLSLLLPSLGKAREEALKAVCMSNQKQLHIGTMLYAKDSGGWVPPPILHIVKEDERKFKVKPLPFWQILPAYLESKPIPNLSEIFFCSKHKSIEREFLNWPKQFPSIGGAFTWTTRVNGKTVNGQYNMIGATSNHWNKNVTKKFSDTSRWLLYGDSPSHQNIKIKKGTVLPPPNQRHNGKWVQVAFDGHTNIMHWKSLNSAIETNLYKGDWGGNSLFLIPE